MDRVLFVLRVGWGAVVRREEFRQARVIEVPDVPELDRLERSLFGNRETASVILTQQEDRSEPILPPQKVRDVVGSDSLIYFVVGDRQLRRLRVTLGAALAPTRGSLRIYWPGVKLKADPFDHPSVEVLLDEPVAASLEVLAREFDLSRPRVRKEIKHLDDLRRILTQENSELKAELRNAKAALTAAKRAASRKAR